MPRLDPLVGYSRNIRPNPHLTLRIHRQMHSTRPTGSLSDLLSEEILDQGRVGVDGGRRGVPVARRKRERSKGKSEVGEDGKGEERDARKKVSTKTSTTERTFPDGQSG